MKIGMRSCAQRIEDSLKSHVTYWDLTRSSDLDHCPWSLNLFVFNFTGTDSIEHCTGCTGTGNGSRDASAGTGHTYTGTGSTVNGTDSISTVNLITCIGTCTTCTLVLALLVMVADDTEHTFDILNWNWGMYCTALISLKLTEGWWWWGQIR